MMHLLRIAWPSRTAKSANHLQLSRFQLSLCGVERERLEQKCQSHAKLGDSRQISRGQLMYCSQCGYNLNIYCMEESTVIIFICIVILCSFSEHTFCVQTPVLTLIVRNSGNHSDNIVPQKYNTAHHTSNRTSRPNGENNCSYYPRRAWAATGIVVCLFVCLS